MVQFATNGGYGDGRKIDVARGHKQAHVERAEQCPDRESMYGPHVTGRLLGRRCRWKKEWTYSLHRWHVSALTRSSPDIAAQADVVGDGEEANVADRRCVRVL